MKKLIVILFVLIVHASQAQDYYDPDLIVPESKMNIGLGLGLDYGGIGGRVTFLPIKRLAVFGSIGYAIVNFGYNVGAQLRIIPDGKLCPTLGFMYGYNGVIKIENASAYDKIYYGTTLSAGLEIHFKKKLNFLNVELVVPFRSESFYDDWDKIKQMSNVSVVSEPLPIGISVGYHFALK